MNAAQEEILKAEAERLHRAAAGAAGLSTERPRDIAEELDKACLAQAGREKYWSELSIEEKIERTRLMLKQAFAQIEELNERSVDTLQAAAALRHDLVAHRHDLNDGSKVMFPASSEKTEQFGRLARGRGRRGLDPRPDAGDNVYF